MKTVAPLTNNLTITQRMQNALQYIQTSLDETLDPETVAAEALFSLSHFHRIFKGMLGETLGEHIRRLRLERAAHQLIHSGQPITIIAFNAGYETLESFSRAFKKSMGNSPSRYRQINREAQYPVSESGIHYTPDTIPALRTPKEWRNDFPVRLETLTPIRVAFVRHIGPYMECFHAWQKLCAWAKPKGILSQGPRFLGICYDDPKITPSDRVRYDASLSIDSTIEPEGEVAIKNIAGGDYAIITHHGPYEDLEITYSRIMGGWLPFSGYDLRNEPSFEHYINDYETTKPENLITDVYVPLKKGEKSWK